MAHAHKLIDIYNERLRIPKGNRKLVIQRTWQQEDEKHANQTDGYISSANKYTAFLNHLTDHEHFS